MIESPIQLEDDYRSIFKAIILFRWILSLAHLFNLLWIEWKLPSLILIKWVSILFVVTVITQLIAHRVHYNFQQNYHAKPMGVKYPLVLLSWDVFTLTLQLILSAGPYNPLSSFYLFHLALAVIFFPKLHRFTFSLFTMTNILGLLVYYKVADSFILFPSYSRANLASPEFIRLTIGQEYTFTQRFMHLHIESSWLVTIFMMLIIILVSQKLKKDYQAMQQEAERAKQFYALSALAAGTAHELATPLASIDLHLKNFLSDYYHSNSVNLEHLQQLQLNTHQAQYVIDRLRNTLRTEHLFLQIEVLDFFEDLFALLHETVTEKPCNEVDDLLMNSLQGIISHLNIEYDVDPDLSPYVIKAPIAALLQSIKTIIVNALQAQSQKKVSAPIRLEASLKTSISSPYHFKSLSHCSMVTLTRTHQAHGKYLLISIQDQGVGMSEQFLDKIATPFFSGKAVGEGIGLGVFLAKHVMIQIQATCTYYSKVNHGTIVHIYIPISTTQTTGKE